MLTRAARFGTAVSCFIVSPGNASVAGAAPLQPTKPWILDYAETQCIASRTYGTPGKVRTFAIRPSPNGETFELIMASPGYSPKYAQEHKGSVDFGYGPINSWMLRFSSKNRDMDIYQFRISATEMAQAKTASSVTLRTNNGLASSDVTLTLANMSALLGGLEKCTVNLRQHWNIDDSNGHTVTPAQGDVRGLIKPEDYPAEALERYQTGSVQFLLLIDETGKVAACHVLKPSGIPVLDTRGCQVVQERAKFSPARNSQGKARRSAFVTPVVSWRMTN